MQPPAPTAATADIQDEPVLSSESSEANMSLLSQSDNSRSPDFSDDLDHHEDLENLPWWRTPSAYWLFVPFILLILTIGGTIVPKINLTIDLVCRRYYSQHSEHDPSSESVAILIGGENPQCLDPMIQQRVASLSLVSSLVQGLLSSIITPKVGALSDRYGRTRLMGLVAVGGLLSECVMIACVSFPDAIDYRWLVLGAVFQGLAGTHVAAMVLGNAYTSDCTHPLRRGIAIGYLYACVFIGMALGPILMGFVAKWSGNLLTIFYVGLAAYAFFIAFMTLVVPESLSQKRQLSAREKFEKAEQVERARSKRGHGQSWLSSIRWVNPLEPLKHLAPRGPGSSPQLRRNLVALAVTEALYQGTHSGVTPTTILYSEYAFHWGNLESSVYISSLSAVRSVVVMCIFPVINYIWRTRPARRRMAASGASATASAAAEKVSGADKLDNWILRVSLLADIVGAIGWLTARSSQMFFASGMVLACGALGGATINTMITKHVPSEGLGKLMGAFGMVQALCGIAGPFLFNGLYWATIKTFPRAIFFLAAVAFLMAGGVSMCIRPHVYLSEEVPESEVTLEPWYSDEEGYEGEERLGSL